MEITYFNLEKEQLIELRKAGKKKILDSIVGQYNKLKIKFSLNSDKLSELRYEMINDSKSLDKSIFGNRIIDRYSPAVKYLQKLFNNRGEFDSAQMDSIDKGIINLINDYKALTK